MAEGDGTRIMRNSFLLAIVLFAIVVSAFVISVASLIYMTKGLQMLKLYMTYRPEVIAMAFWYELSTMWRYWWTYKMQLGFTQYNYFTIKLFGTAIAPTAILCFILYRYRNLFADFKPFQKKETVHGNAHWATRSEIKKAKLRQKEGVLLGTDSKGFLTAGGYQHILLFAPTGSGKGVGFVIPNLLFWRESVIVHDIKLENHELTSGWRQSVLKQKTYLWNPADPDGITNCFNPLDWISTKPGKMVDDIQKIASFLLPKQDFWENEARSLLVGVMLYLLADPAKIKSLGEVVRTLRSDDVVYSLAVALDTLGDKMHPVAYMNIASYLQKPDKERGSVTSTANSSLELWANPLIDTATATSDFDLQMLRREPHSIYVGLTPDNIARLKPLMQIFYQQITSFMTAKMPAKDEKYGVLMVMDEFPTLGKLEQFLAGIAYFRGYRVRLFLIIQDTQQLKGIYEESGMNSFLSNATYRITFAANNMDTANLISQLCGNKTVQQFSYSKPKFLDLNPAARTLNVSEVQRALMLPQEVLTMPADDQLLLIEASPPIRSKKIKYYSSSFFKKRLLKRATVPTQKPYMPNRQKKTEEKKEDENEEG